MLPSDMIVEWSFPKDGEGGVMEGGVMEGALEVLRTVL